MWIKKVYAKAFGPFRKQTIELAPGMNVLYGPNEAGKSSWHAAIYAGLCGMSRARGRRPKEEQDFVDRHRPWKGDEWEVSVTVQLLDGQMLEISQDLEDPSNSRVVDPDTGKDVTDKLVSGGSPDGATLLGLTRRTLPSTLVVRQAQVLQVREEPGNLQEQLQRAAATSGADETAEGAIDQIRKFHAVNVGTERAKTKPLQVARATLETKASALEAAREKHTAYVRLFEEYLEAKSTADKAEQAREDLEQRLNFSRLQILRSRANRARELKKKLPDDAPPDLGKLRTMRDRVRDTLQRFDNRPAEPTLLSGPSSADLEREIAELPEEPQGDQDVLEDVKVAERKWRDAVSKLEEHGAHSPESTERPETGNLGSWDLRQLSDALEAPIPKVDPELVNQLADLTSAKSVGRRLPMVAIVGGLVLSIVGGVLLLNAIQVLGFSILGLGILLVVIGFIQLSSMGGETRQVSVLESRLAVQRQVRMDAEQKRSAAETRIGQAGLTTDTTELRRLAGAVDDAESALRASGKWQERRDDLNKNVLSAADQVRSLVRPRLGDPNGVNGIDVEELINRYTLECEQRRKQAAQADRRKQLKGTLTSRKAAEERAAADKEAREKAANDVLELATDLGIGGETVEPSVDDLRTKLEDLEREIAEAEQKGKDFAALEEILRGESLESLELAVERLEKRLGDYEGKETESGDVSDLENELAALTKKVQEMRRERDELAGRVNSFPVPDVPALEETVEMAIAELLRLETLDKTLNTTLSFLERAKETVQRNIAPRLKASIEKRLALVTEGRYDEAAVDPETLEVNVRPAGGTFRSAELLSQGTTEQVYLLLRVALAEHMTTTEEVAPIFFDDATVQSDATRTRAILDVLHRISEERQIVVFSQEEEVLAWARGNLRSNADELVELAAGDRS